MTRDSIVGTQGRTFNKIDALQNDILNAASEVFLNNDSALIGILHAADGYGVVQIKSDEGSFRDARHSKTVHRYGDVLRLALDDHVVPLVIVQQ